MINDHKDLDPPSKTDLDLDFLDCFRIETKGENQLLQLCTARTVFSILFTVIHCDAGGVSLVNQ